MTPVETSFRHYTLLTSLWSSFLLPRTWKYNFSFPHTLKKHEITVLWVWKSLYHSDFTETKNTFNSKLKLELPYSDSVQDFKSKTPSLTSDTLSSLLFPFLTSFKK